MITMPAADLNEVSITGQVLGATFYEDNHKLVFTVKNPDGNFCVEFHPLGTEVGVRRGDKVMVTGSLFSLRSGEHHTTKIRARLVRVMDFDAVNGDL